MEFNLVKAYSDVRNAMDTESRRQSDVEIGIGTAVSNLQDALTKLQMAEGLRFGVAPFRNGLQISFSNRRAEVIFVRPDEANLMVREPNEASYDGLNNQDLEEYVIKFLLGIL